MSPELIIAWADLVRHETDLERVKHELETVKQHNVEIVDLDGVE